MSWIFSLCYPGAYEPLKLSHKKVDNSTSPSCFCFGFDSFDFCGYLVGLLFKGDPCFIVIVDETGTKRQFPSRVWRNGEVADWGGLRDPYGVAGEVLGFQVMIRLVKLRNLYPADF